MPVIEIRPTIPEDLPHVIDEPLPFRIKAVTGLVDGRVVGIGGIGYLPGGSVAAFTALLPEARKYKVSLHKAALQVMAMIKDDGHKRVVALADGNIEPAERWLERLGFKAIKHKIGSIYTWQR